MRAWLVLGVGSLALAGGTLLTVVRRAANRAVRPDDLMGMVEAVGVSPRPLNVEQMTPQQVLAEVEMIAAVSDHIPAPRRGGAR